jgi:hypothetical protein
MYDKNLKNSTALAKVIIFMIFAVAIAFTLIQKPKLSKELQVLLRETVFKTYGGPMAETGWNVINTGDGFLITADTASFGAGNKDVYLIKTDEKGGLIWTRTYGDAGADTGIGLCKANDSGFLTAGGTSSYGSGETDVYVVKIDKDGELIWDRTFGGTNYDYAYSISPAPGGYILTGYTSSFSKNPDSDLYLLKINEKGEKLWEKTFGGASWEAGYSVISLRQGGYAIAGYTDSYGSGKTDMYIIRTDASGNCVWARTFGGIREDRASSIIQAKDNNLVIAGKSGSYAARGFGWDIVLIKVDLGGNSLWSRVFPAADLDAGNAVVETEDRGYIIAGTKKCYGICDSNVYVIKTDSQGNSLWARIFAGKSDDSAAGECLSPDGSITVCGTTLSYGNGRGDVLLMNIDKNGEKVW